VVFLSGCAAQPKTVSEADKENTGDLETTPSNSPVAAPVSEQALQETSALRDVEGTKPNIVLVFMDNFGWGEPGFNGGGITRGAPTPQLDLDILLVGP
jgi:hypothetical protein